LEKPDCPTLRSLKTTSYRSSDESSLTESDAVVARDKAAKAAGQSVEEAKKNALELLQKWSSRTK
jgi:hypothetical protein